ncbi:hypothetical protein DAEQUDRAFT_722364 [Daedalea quercina L-15889]|uniref:Uncharacterized protein n=1 Tax=Daedalea quercina L-15889 TaxID=1314783 RepID=A0A165T0F1_9APHY|nr:hypothetical protein DAEQUDRAFT_722364 [Daedalea quercina L-15889]
MKPRDYCCCAIPVIYTGIYTALLEQFALGVVAGTLAIGTPDIVGATAATPSAAKWIFAIICYVGAALQLMGFAAVRKEKPTLFRRYTTLHLLVTLGAFSVAVVWIILSAARHSKADAACKSTFFGTDSDLSDEGNTLCNIFSWVDVGIMGGLWVLLAIMQAYMYFVLSSYIAGQEFAHNRYDSMYDATKPLASDIPLADRADPWESRASMDAPRGYHNRSESIESVSTVVGNKAQQPREYGDYGQTSYPPDARHDADSGAQNAGSTPVVNSDYSRDVEHPDHL